MQILKRNPQNDEEDLLYTHKPENRVAVYNGTLLFAENLVVEVSEYF